MNNPLIKSIEIIKTGSREEAKKAQKDIEKYWHNIYIPKRTEGKKKFSIFLNEIKYFNQIKDIDHQYYFINTLKWPLMAIGKENFKEWSEFFLKQIQNSSGKIRQATINAVDNLMLDSVFDLKFGPHEKMTENEKEESHKIQDQFGNFVFKVIELQEKHNQPKFNRYKYIPSLPTCVYKSVTKLIREVLLRSKHYEELYGVWLKKHDLLLSQLKKGGESNLRNAVQLKIILKDTKPPIWRRVVIPENYNLYDLHKVVQLCFGWYDYHLHGFEIKDVHYQLPDPENDPIFGTHPDERKIFLSILISEGIKSFNYEYDFGDSWDHRIEIEKISDKKIDRPACIAGKNAAPFEDSGGPWGYYDKVEIIKNPKHKEHKEILEWAGFESIDEFDPEFVDFDLINNDLQNIENYDKKYE